MYDKLFKIAKANSNGKLEIDHQGDILDIFPSRSGLRFYMYKDKLRFKGYLKDISEDDEIGEDNGVIGFWVVEDDLI